MPIQFTCEHCSQKLNVGSRRAGQAVLCPKCQATIRVPSNAVRTEQADPSPAQPVDSGKLDDPYAEFVVYDDAELVYDGDASGAAQQARPVVRDLVAVPRRFLYLQGILLGAVAVGSFAMGIKFAGRTVSPDAEAHREPCLVSGVLSYRTRNGLELPDEGAVVIAVPTQQRPGSNGRVAIEGLRPGDPRPKASHESLQRLRTLGGDYARTDQFGAYELRLVSGGDYYVLFLSDNAARGPNEQLDKRDLAQLGRYFHHTVELLGDRRYDWRELAVRGDRSVDVSF